MHTENVFVQLLNEGTVVFRPVAAIVQQDGIYILQAPEDYDPKLEDWEFSPGDKVVCEWRNLSDGPALIAVSKME